MLLVDNNNNRDLFYIIALFPHQLPGKVDPHCWWHYQRSRDNAAGRFSGGRDIVGGHVGNGNKCPEILMGDHAMDPHFKVIVIGRTKEVQQDGRKFGIPCIKKTKTTGLRPGVWVKRLVDLKTLAGETHGKSFVRKLGPSKLMEFAINRWRKEASTKLGVVRMDMADTYTTLEFIMPLIMEFSQALL